VAAELPAGSTEARRSVAVLHLLLRSDTLHTLKEEFGMSHEEAAATSSWLVQVVVNEIKRLAKDRAGWRDGMESKTDE
jgi:hypothetical protein